MAENESTSEAVRRLLVICHGFPPYYGGAEHVAYYLARAAAQSGRYRVTVLTSDIGGRLASRETMEGMSIIRVPGRKKAWTRHTSGELLSFYWSARRRLNALMREIEPDYVLAHFAFPAGAVARAMHDRQGIPYAAVLHGSDVPGYQPGRFRWLYPLYRPLFRRVCEHADHVMAVSAELSALSSKSWCGPIAVIQNGVDTRRFRPELPGHTDRTTLRVVVTAQLIKRKGLDYLMTALADMPDEMRSALDVDVYGEGPYRASLEEGIRRHSLNDRFRLCGLLGADRMPEMLRQADVYVMPSLQEGLPLALLEAMAAGLPVIATRVGGIPSVLTHGTNALLVEPADPAGLREAIETLVRDANLRGQLGRAARRTAETMDWAEIWKQYARLLFTQ